VQITKSELENCTSTVDLLSEISKRIIFPSKGEARKMIQAGGVSINKIKIGDPNQKPVFKLLQNKYLLAQKGKKNYFLITVE
jgi:tyrosyl-tRNA synthetase